MPRPSCSFGSLTVLCAGVAVASPAHAQLGAILDNLFRPPPPSYYHPPPPYPPPPAYAPAYVVPAPVYRAQPRRQTARADASVAEAQRMLTDLGYNPGPVDGAAGRRLTEAVRSFQSDHGQAQDGRLNEATLNAMRTAWHERTRTAAKPSTHDEAATAAPAAKHVTPAAEDEQDVPLKLR